MSWSVKPDGKSVVGVNAAWASNDDRDDDRDDRDDQKTSAPKASGNSASKGSGKTGGVPDDLHLRYGNGWDEQIRSGRYILIDPKGRKVTNRRATMQDLRRMRSAAGL